MHKIKPLKYSFDQLEPYLSEETMKKHYRIYMNYINKLNEIIGDSDYTLEDIIKNIDKFEIQKRNEILYTTSAILNHELYFNNMSINKNMPVGELKQQINEQYGNFENFKKEFKKQASYVVGSGYTFLVMNGKKLEIINTSNQENPYIYGLIPIMALDLWEHAYYLDYFNREEYINSFFSIVDLEQVNNNYEKNIK